ncbi:hypothetical protein C8A00DRAFT_42423 [Chaetomidium leptoderma]|uniref:Uncharacterized protein n=1 Tax=Chaetomidium leptoderma TaxID=669021 RepID=A0AAN6VNI9_9PEZI|nr:hypothetical protein C8A00DRAFT_42423 [Chaetomidium leptoderma]
MSSSSAVLGLTTRALLSARATGPGRTSPISAGRALRLRLLQANRLPPSSPFTSTSQCSHSAEQRSPKTEMNQQIETNRDGVAAQALSMVVPGTFVIPPISQLPKPLGQKLRFLGSWFVMKTQESITNAALRFTSKPTIFKRAAFKPKRRVIIPTAKALHRSMAEALAAGDRHTISKICSKQLSIPLLASIDARPRGRRYGWELVKYTNKLFYPSIRSHRMAPISRDRNAPIVRQAVVAISSKQRRVEYDSAGQLIPGSEKEMDVVENVAIGCIVDPRSWEQREWRLIGTVKSTTYEGWNVEKEQLKAMLRAP